MLLAQVGARDRHRAARRAVAGRDRPPARRGGALRAGDPGAVRRALPARRSGSRAADAASRSGLCPARRWSYLEAVRVRRCRHDGHAESRPRRHHLRRLGFHRPLRHPTLARAGWRVRVAVRRPDEAGFVRPYGPVGQVEPIQANIRDEASTRRAIAGADAVVNCVGILVESGKQSSGRWSTRAPPGSPGSPPRKARPARALSAIGADPAAPAAMPAPRPRAKRRCWPPSPRR